jgi:3-dehydroquinate synthase
MMQFNIDTKRHHSTRVVVQKGLFNLLRDYVDFSSSKNFVLIDENVLELYRSEVESLFGSGSESHVISIPHGEKSKSMDLYVRLTDFLLENGVRRNSKVFAIGGGVTGDLAGFVAASVHRGLRLIHVPTTLLAMVDSAIGGKTGINHQTGKNLIGAFYQADSVLIDTDFLKSLPVREWNCGFGEVLKYGCISKPVIFDQVGEITDWNQISDLDALIADCANIKAGVVMRDELESGERAFLNYGHTFAHALEQVTNFSRFAHGEAVYLGLIAATWLSSKLGANVNVDTVLRYKKLFNLDTSGLELKLDELIHAMHRDKKMNSETLKLILLDSFGSPKIVTFDDYTLLKQAWTFSIQQLNCANTV